MSEWFNSIIGWVQAGDIWMLAFISFIESFISPILPDILLIPLSLAHPEKALFYALICIGANIVGGYIGYGIGFLIGPPAFNKFVPQKHQEQIKSLAVRRGVWAVFIASILPIPFKIVAISAGAMRLPLGLFTLAAVLGRTKRFLPIGIILHFYGPDILYLWDAYTAEFAWSVAIFLCLGILWYWFRKRK